MLVHYDYGCLFLIPQVAVILIIWERCTCRNGISVYSERHIRKHKKQEGKK